MAVSLSKIILVDETYGTWDDIKELSKDANIMTDLVLNHASSEGQWYKNF